MPCRTMCTVCGFAALSHSYFIRLYMGFTQSRKIPCCLNFVQRGVLSRLLKRSSRAPYCAYSLPLCSLALC
ncbi:hypothetical protein D0T90_07995 [Neisseria animalis]|uniref:Uncharacterized protein n=1 Tax=Neisseria animalis TaxID=492 RepID=A0A5P3MUT6_NEIAN|nr:hypothetical protein D0T90_07995 [Neisseria animalis]ROW31896.1 hypothetical protein CGZ60_07750 [Neisseria animalis]